MPASPIEEELTGLVPCSPKCKLNQNVAICQADQ